MLGGIAIVSPPLGPLSALRLDESDSLLDIEDAAWPVPGLSRPPHNVAVEATAVTAGPASSHIVEALDDGHTSVSAYEGNGSENSDAQVIERADKTPPQVTAARRVRIESRARVIVYTPRTALTSEYEESIDTSRSSSPPADDGARETIRPISFSTGSENRADCTDSRSDASGRGGIGGGLRIRGAVRPDDDDPDADALHLTVDPFLATLRISQSATAAVAAAWKAGIITTPRATANGTTDSTNQDQQSCLDGARPQLRLKPVGPRHG